MKTYVEKCKEFNYFSIFYQILSGQALYSANLKLIKMPLTS